MDKEKQLLQAQDNSCFSSEDFGQMITKDEIKRFLHGVHYDLYNLLGAHKKVIENIEGIYFTLWAPNAKEVFLQGDFADKPISMNFIYGGIYGLFVPGVEDNSRYLFEIISKDGSKELKTDPFGYFFDLRPDFHAKVFDLDKYDFRDRSFLEKRKKSSLKSPMNIYEVHLGSWKKSTTSQDSFLNYRELAHSLAAYIIEMGYTHIELMPITEHPLDESWGYQVTGFFAPTSRFGTPSDFQYFVDYLHLNDIGIIMDWVGAHFPLDAFALAKFDGTCLFEYEDPLKGYHPVWNTAMFDYSKPEVTNFLIASILFFIEKYHIDGFRLDAVSSMLYLDHERTDGQWEKNREGHNIHLESISFIRHLNEIIHLKHPDVLMIAEESTSYKGVTQPIEEGGLGFDLKWNMGWMNDSLHYFSTDPKYRYYLFDQICFSHTYSFSEKFLLPYSHDEVVYGKKSLFSKMKTKDPKRELRLLFMYQYCHPGKKLTFMGQELGQTVEWDYGDQIAWHLLEEDSSFHEFVKRLNAFYFSNSALWQEDFTEEGFEWFISDSESSVVGFFRKRSLETQESLNNEFHTLLCLFHFQEGETRIKIPPNITLKPLFHSDQNTKDSIINKKDCTVLLKPLAASIFGVIFEKRDH